MKNTEYYQSGKHKHNVLLAGIKGNEKIQLNKTARISSYNDSPTTCSFCKTALDYKIRKNKFCSSSCAAKFNNSKRPPRTEASKIKTSNSMKGRPNPNKGLTLENYIRKNPTCSVILNTCIICNKKFYTKGKTQTRKTCGSNSCIIHSKVGNRPYINGRRKLFYYFNKHQDKKVLLESTWEFDLATWLDEQGIVWLRPAFIPWYDQICEKDRIYYPDFYLPEFNLYLDPKNPTAMKHDQYKMSQVEKLVPIIYGNIPYLQEQINGLRSQNRTDDP